MGPSGTEIGSQFRHFRFAVLKPLFRLEELLVPLFQSLFDSGLLVLPLGLLLLQGGLVAGELFLLLSEPVFLFSQLFGAAAKLFLQGSAGLIGLCQAGFALLKGLPLGQPAAANAEKLADSPTQCLLLAEQGLAVGGQGTAFGFDFPSGRLERLLKRLQRC